MINLSEKQKNRLTKLLQVMEGGDLELLKLLSGIEEKLDSMTEIAKGEKGDKGERGEVGPQGERGEMGPQGNDGKDGKDGTDGRDGNNGKDGKDGENGKDGSPDTGDQIIEKINEVSEEGPKIDAKHIKNLPETVKHVTGGGARGIQLYTNGTKRGMAQMVNIIPGIGVSLTYDYAQGRNDITINASASTSVLTATGTINDSNTAFTFASEPAILIINGASYQQTGGAITWTWTAGTSTVTLSSPVGSGGSIFGLS